MFTVYMMTQIGDPYIYKKLSYRRDSARHGRYAVQGHSRSMMLVPIASPYMTSYYRTNE